MLLTRIWAVILAVLATGCLAGMFLLSAGSGGDFSDADRDAVRAVTEAGVAALTAEISASRVQEVTGLVLDERVREAAIRDDAGSEPEDADYEPLSQVLAEATEELRVRTGSNGLTVALVDNRDKVLAANGISQAEMSAVVTEESFKQIPPDEEGLFSAFVRDTIQVVKVSKVIGKGRRLVAVDELNLGAGSLLRRVLGSETPAGIVRNEALAGGIIGDQPITDEIEALATAYGDEVPDEGSSLVFTMGSGLDKRIGAMGRVPGPAGRGESGSILVVMSRETAAASQQDIAAAIADARRRGVRVNWPILLGLLLVSAALAVYLPHLEAIGPLRRLTHEFEALAVGQQHQVFHDRYSGTPGLVARAAAGAYEALRQAFLAELEIEDDIEDDTGASRQRPRTSRHRRLTRAHQKLSEGASSEQDTSRRKRGRTGAQASVQPRDRTPTVSETKTPEAKRAPAPAPAPEPTPTPTPAAPPLAAEPEPMPAPEPVVPAPPAPAPAPASAAPAPTPTAAPMPAADGSEDDYQEIFEEFVQVKQACGEPTDNLTYDRFAAKLRKNERDLKKKRPNIKRVRFTVYVKDGKAALKAKVVK